MKLRPMADKLIVKVLEQEEITKGGILLPDTAKEKQQRGKIVAIGPGKLLESGQRIPIDVKEGDEIIFGKYAGTEIKIEGEEYLIVDQEEALAVIK